MIRTRFETEEPCPGPRVTDLVAIERRYPGILDMIRSGVTYRKIGRRYKLTHEGVRAISLRFRIDRPSRNSELEKKVAAHIEDLGKFPDPEIARRCEVRVNSVYRIRRKLGIAGYSGSKSDKIVKFEASLGVLPDNEIARAVGMVPSSVRRFRLNRGIAAVQKQKRWSPIDRDLVTRLFDAGASDRVIGIALGLSAASTGTVRRRMGLRREPPGSRDAKSVIGKWAYETRRNFGVPWRQIAGLLPVPKSGKKRLDISALMVAKAYALSNELPWPPR